MEDARAIKPQGMLRDADVVTPSVPKGKAYLYGSILPIYSPALTGGGISDNFLKDMMKDGGIPGMPPGMAGLMGGGDGGDSGGAASSIEAKKKKKRG